MGCVIISCHLLWWRFLRGKMASSNVAVKAATIILLAGFLTLVALAVFFALVQHNLSATYTFRYDLVYEFR